MPPEQLKSARLAAGLTQQLAAARLGISQAYLAMLERGRRPVTARLASKIAKLYRLGPTALPLDSERAGPWNSASLAAQLAALGYPGFSHLARRGKKNPAAVLLGAILENDVEVRVIEALPWLVVEYSDLDWQWLMREARLRDAQNRLGFLVALARQVAEKLGNSLATGTLRQVEEDLDRSRLVREDTLCRASLSDAERRWLRQRRSPTAHYWNLLTTLDTESLSLIDSVAEHQCLSKRKMRGEPTPTRALNGSGPCTAEKPMDKTVRVFTSLDEMKAEEYRYWQSRPVHERMEAVADLTLAAYALKGAAPDAQRLQRTLVQLERPRR